MDRRDSLKTIFLGGVGSSLLLSSCITDKEYPIEAGDSIEEKKDYGRTPVEEQRDEELFSKTFFSKEEMITITTLADVIIPEDEESISATAAEVPAFIEFIVKDLPVHQIPMRGGLAWLNRESNKRFDQTFNELIQENQMEIIDSIAYPEDFEKNTPGPVFFRNIRDLVVTGYFTSEPGLKFLDYRGNIPNVWDGVPPHILEKHGLKYDEDFLKVALDPNSRHEVMTWDDNEV